MVPFSLPHSGRFPEAPVGLVITHLASEHADFVPAAERTEQAGPGARTIMHSPGCVVKTL